MDIEEKHRHTGRTTSLALRAISDAYTVPDYNHPLEDHYAGSSGTMALVQTVQQVLDRLGLQGFSVSGPIQLPYLRYSPPSEFRPK